MTDDGRRRLLKTIGALGTAGLAGYTGSKPAEAVTNPPPQEQIDIQRWTAAGDFAAGQFEGTAPKICGKALAMTHAIGERDYTDPHGGGTKTWEYGRWTSQLYSVGFDADHLVASWVADVPRGTWLEVEMRGETTSGETTGWYVMGRWAATNDDIHRTAVFGQYDQHGGIAIDTFEAASGVALSSYQLRVTLHREPGSNVSPGVRTITGSASTLPQQSHVDPSPVGGGAGITLDVSQYSQMVHQGEYEQWGGGGEVWCSPTSTAMVADYWGYGPTDEQLSWVDSSCQDPQVVFAARGTYDHSYGGTGNWPFNVAYAGRLGLDGFVTRLYSLNELEEYIQAGIPIVTSQSFDEQELPGSGYSTNGHLMLIVGFTEDGDVVANDPYAATNDDVRVVYPRADFENVWQRTSGTGGIAYVIFPPGHELPNGVQ